MTSDVLYTKEDFYNGNLRIKYKIQKVPLHVTVYKILHDLIESGELTERDRMPSEKELVDLLGVGRSTVRMALLLLHEDGYIKIRQGKGSYIDNRYKNKNAGLKNKIIPREIISDVGMEYGVCQGTYAFTKEDHFLINKLNAKKDDEIGALLAVHTADSRPAIITQDYFIAKDELYNENLKYEQAQALYEDMCKSQMKNVLFSVSPTTAEGVRKSKLKVSSSTLLLLVAHEIMGEKGILSFSKYYFNTDIIKYSFIQ